MAIINRSVLDGANVVSDAPTGRSGNDLPCAVSANERPTVLLDRQLIHEIRRIGHAMGQEDLLSGFVCKLEGHLASFDATFTDYIARGDVPGAERAAHTLKGTCRQLGAQALGDLFADIERSVKAGDYAEAKRKLDGGASLITQSLDALRRA